MKNLNQILVKYSNWFLGLFFVIALILRWWYLPQKAITFAYDQARDAFWVQEILQGHLKVFGPPVSGVPGLFHGVLYYYIIAPAYFFGHGNPVFVAYWISFLNACCIFVVFFLTQKMLRSKLPALIAAAIFAVSFEQTQYAIWLSNPSMGVWFVLLIYVGLYLWVKNRKLLYLLITGLAYGFAIQSNFALAYHIVPICYWLWFSRRDLRIGKVFALVFSFIISISSMILAEVRFGLGGLGGIKYLLIDQQIQGSGQSQYLGNFIVSYLNHMGNVFSYNLFPLLPALGGLIGLFVLITYAFKLRDGNYKYSLEISFLIFWILSFLPAASIAGITTPHNSVGIGVGLIIIISIYIWEIAKKYKFLAISLLFIIILANVIKIISENKNGQTIFAIQKDLILSNEIKAVDSTYQKADGSPFSISSLTSPLFVNTLWSYLYNWYGKPKYGYLPYWIGHDQIGQLGDNLEFAPSNAPEHFFIIEPTYGIPELWVTYAKGDQDSISKLSDQKSFGELIVQERVIKK